MADDDALEMLPEAAFHVDARSAVGTCNRSAVNLLGPDPAALSAALADVAGFGEWLAGPSGEPGSSDEVFRSPLRIRRPTGVPVTVELSARRDPDGSGAVCLLTTPDRERVASDAQRYFDIAFDAAPIGMALFNTDGEYIRVNAALCTLLGRPAAELLGRRDQELTHPDDRQGDVDAAWRILSGEINTWQCEKRFVRADGGVVWTIANLTFLRDEAGNPISWVGQFQDITERKRDEKERLATLSLLAATLDATADGILVVDGHGRIASFNRRFAEMWRLPEPVLASGDDAAALASVLDQLTDPEAFAAKVDELYHDPAADSHDVLEFRDGRVFERTSNPQRVGGEIVGRVWSFHDVTERRRLEVDLAAALAQAQEASRLKSVFLATMSHEIRTPMNGVLGLAELLLASDVDPTQRRHLLALRDSGQSLMALISDILDFSKIEAGRMKLDEVDFELVECVRSVATIVSTRAAERGLDLLLHFDAGLGGRVRGDSLRLRQVLMNLTNNAVKFTHSGTVTISVDLAGDARVRFRVVDTGIGIDAAARDSLLDPFSQADSSTTRLFGGTGLGLAICAELVGLMGGTLDFDSEVGRGSTFWFEIPLPPADDTRSSIRADGDLTGARVLLADDARINRLVGVAILERLGCVVDVVANGAEAIEAVRRTRYDAVLMECVMPVIDGFEAAARIRRLEAGAHRTPIIAITASATAADSARCLAAGMDECLSKPLDRAALAGALARHCAGTRAAAG